MDTYSSWPSEESSKDLGSAAEPPHPAADSWPEVVRPAEWFLRVPDADEPGQPTARALGATPALHGRPGGPGFEPNPAGSAADRSQWQQSEWLWSESGIQWDVSSDAETGLVWEATDDDAVMDSPGAASPADLSARSLGPVARWRSQASYQGRHARQRLVPVQSAVPLGAPVLTSQDTVPDHDQASGLAPGKRRGRRVAAVVLPTVVLGTVAAVAIALLAGHPLRSGHAKQTSAGKPVSPQAPRTIGMYSGQQGRGVFQQIDGIAGYGDTIVTTGSESSDGQVRQQFFLSPDSGATWRLAQVREADGAQPSLGHAATRIAGGPAGWLAVGPQAVWTSRNGLSWTLAAVRGIAARPGDQVQALTATASGFLAGGAEGTQGAVWVSHDRINWQRLPATRLGLAPGEAVRDISAATSRGPDTVISGTVARGRATYAGVWLSSDGGSSWTRVAVPADHGAAGGIVGLGSDAAGFLAVRPGGTAGGVAYFSLNGQRWRYAGTIDPAGGWSPSAVNGGNGGFAVTGQTAAGTIVAYTSTGTGVAWTPTGSLGVAASESVLSPAMAADGTVVAAGSTDASGVGQQGVLLEAKPAGRVRSVPLAASPGAVVPELAVNGMATAGDVQVAVGGADGYPAIWRRDHGGSWALMSSSTLTSGQDHLAALTGVTRGPKGWLAVGLPGPLVFTSADGITWQPAPGHIAQDLAGVSTVKVAASTAGYVIAGNLGGRVAGLWWSPDLTSWSRAGGLNHSQVLAVAADVHGFVSVGSHDGKPAAWTTSNGRSWTAVVLPLPAGASSAVLQQVAIMGSRVAALGQATTPAGVVPFAALSVNGGTNWLRVPFASPGSQPAFIALIAGSRGFTAVGQYGPPGYAAPAAWTSAGGTTWARSPLSGLTRDYHVSALVPAGPTATAIGSISTQRSQGAFMVGVPAP